MATGVLDSGVVIGWLQRRPRGLARIDALMAGARSGRAALVMSVVNLAEVIRHTATMTRDTGVDPLDAMRAGRIAIHVPDEEIARRVARFQTSLADGFAAATAFALRARLHTSDTELAGQLRGTGVAVTLY